MVPIRFAKALVYAACFFSGATLLPAGAALSQAPGVNEHPAEVPADRRVYALYSWPVKDGWRFSLLPSPRGANLTPKEIFDRKFLVRSPEELDRYLFTMRNGTQVVWHEKLASAADSEDGRAKNLKYPPTKIIERVRALAEAHKVVLLVGVAQEN